MTAKPADRGTGGLPPRARALLVVLAIVVAGSVGYRKFVRPSAAASDQLEQERTALRQQAAELREALAHVEAARRQIQQDAEATEATREQLERMERQLITSSEFGRLLDELSAQGVGLRLIFDSIKQHVQEEANRSNVAIDVGFTAPYEDLVNYIARVETLSPFLQVAQLEVKEPKDGQQGVGAAELTLVTPLRVSSEPGGLTTGKRPAPAPLTVSRNPFSGVWQDLVKPKKDIKVTGITVNGPESTAIINNEVMRVGDQVDRLLVQEILPDRVVVSDGTTEYTIPLTP